MPDNETPEQPPMQPPVQPPLNGGEEGGITTVDIEDEVQRSYLDYAMSVIVGRALPDVRDGLKPVHRRILWGMDELGARPGSAYLKCARVVGDVMGKYHPHGDAAIYDALARMAQNFAMRQTLVDGKGNFGSVDGDRPAAMRYCITGDTLVRTLDGTVPIAELADVEPNAEVDLDRKVLDHHGNPVLATKLFHSGSHPTFRVRTAEGYEITGTANHPLLCLESVAGVPLLQWRTIEEIRPSSYVVIAREPTLSGAAPSTSDVELGLLAGAFVAEGWMSGGRAGFNNTDKVFFDRVVAAYDRIVGGPRYLNGRPLKSGKPTYEIDIHNLASLASSPLGEMIGLKSSLKHVPRFVWRASLDLKRAFLQALFEGDGCVSLLPRNSCQIYYSTYSPRLAADVQQLLLEFGVVSRRQKQTPTGEYKVLISNRRDVRLFQRNVGFLTAKRAALEEALATVPLSSTAMSSDHVPFVAAYIRSEAGRGGLRWLKKRNIDRVERWELYGEDIRARIRSSEVISVVEPLVSGSHLYARVTAVEDAGVRPVYSIRVDSDAHAFLANGFVNHNTESRLSPLAMELLRDIKEDTVDFTPNYDGSEREPLVLPARFPNLLVNGSTGIAVGMATNIPPHNLAEVIDAAVAVLDNPDITSEELLSFVKGPDFPGGGYILGRSGIRDAYETGRGTIRVRGHAEIEETKRGTRIVITKLPYMVSGDRLLEKVKELVDAKRIVGVSGGRNESSRKGLRIVIELKRDAMPQVVLNNLYKYTQLQDSFGMNMLALVDGVPRTLPLADILRAYVTHQVEVMTRRTRFRLHKAEERMHILEGLLVALDHLDEVIALIRAAASAEEARGELMSRFGLSEIQATAILDMMLRRLAALESQKLREEAAELAATIAELRSILESPVKLRRLIKEEMLEIKTKFADARRTEITPDGGDIDDEDLIPDEDVVVTITRSGYVKRTKSAIYKTQGRGGKGVIGAKPKEGDIVAQVLTTTNHAFVLVFSNRGKVYRIKAHEIPEKERIARGVSIRNILPFGPEESVAAILDTKDFATHKYLVIATRKGIIKKTEFTAYNTSRRDGVIALNLREDDEVVSVRATAGTDELIMVSRKAMAIRFAETDVRPMGRTAGGVIAMKLDADDEVVAFDVVDQNGELLIVTDGGYGKRTDLKHYTAQHRGGKGVIAAKLPGKRGFVAGAYVVRPGNEVFLIASDGQVIRMEARSISKQGRVTTGVRVMGLDPGVSLVALAPVTEE